MYCVEKYSVFSVSALETYFDYIFFSYLIYW